MDEKLRRAASGRTPDALRPEPSQERLVVNGVEVAWDRKAGVCTFRGIPVALMWVDSTLAGLMAGVGAMVGPERFALALQAEGRKSVDSDWALITAEPTFEEGFAELNLNAAVAGWGDWQLVSLDREQQRCVFRAYNNWEGLYQKALGVCWGSGMLAGKFAGICTKLFGTNCWATQRTFVATGDEYDEFVVEPSQRSVEDEIEKLLATDRATRADMAVAVEKLRASGTSLQTEVSERVRTEAELRASESRLAGIVASAADAIISVDERQNITLFNAAAERIFGLPAAEALGTNIERFVPEGYRAQHRVDVERFAAHGTTTRRMGAGRVTAVRASGESFQAEAHVSRVHVGDRTMLTVVLRDLTEELRAEADRRTLNDQLRHAQRLEAIGTLAGGIAHDFNNVLAAILANVELAERDTEAGLSVAESLREIRQASVRAKALVKQILAFSRKQPSSNATIVSLPTVVGEVTHLMRATLPASVSLTTTIADLVPNILGDPTQIHQVLMNLCTNSWQALQGKPGNIRITLDEVDCDEHFARLHPDIRPGRYARLSVTDDGCGMDAATRERIFEPFFSTKKVGEGTGLGLSVVHGIVRAHKGAIFVDSTLGRGSSFHIFFPSAAGAEAIERISRPAPSIRGAGEHVLYVDDEAPVVDACAKMLRLAGYQVTSMTSSPAAIALIERDPSAFSIVVSDFNMPGASGLDVARAALRARPDLPVVIASGYVTPELRAQAEAIGVREVIGKPFALYELLELVHRHVRSEQAATPVAQG